MENWKLKEDEPVQKGVFSEKEKVLTFSAYFLIGLVVVLLGIFFFFFQQKETAVDRNGLLEKSSSGQNNVPLEKEEIENALREKRTDILPELKTQLIEPGAEPIQPLNNEEIVNSLGEKNQEENAVPLSTDELKNALNAK